MWLPAFLLLFAGICSAQKGVAKKGVATKPTDVETPASLSIRPPESCNDYKQYNSSRDLQIPHICCQFNTWKCYWEHNGMCKHKWDAGRCDYTVDVCPSWNNHFHYCTCCATCKTKGTKCEDNKGRCRKNCLKSEYYAWWYKCHYNQKPCRCCKKRCPVPTCANGAGLCRHNSESCPRGYYPSKEHKCVGWGCKCCVRCRPDPECTKKKGFCEDNKRKCPFGYVTDKCPCPDDECRCCRWKWFLADSALPVAAKMSQQMEVNFPSGGSNGDDDPGYPSLDEIEAMEGASDEDASDEDASDEDASDEDADPEPEPYEPSNNAKE